MTLRALPSRVELRQFDRVGTWAAYPAVEGVFHDEGAAGAVDGAVEADHERLALYVVLAQAAPAEPAGTHRDEFAMPAVHQWAPDAAWSSVGALSKGWAQAHLKPAGTTHGDLQFAVVTNRGSAWGLGSSSPSWVLGAEVAGIPLVLWWLSTRTTTAEKVSAAVLLGGGVANLVDRLVHGAVTDWIRVAPYPAYVNVADIAVRGGLVAAAVLAAARHRTRAGEAPTAPRLGPTEQATR